MSGKAAGLFLLQAVLYASVFAPAHSARAATFIVDNTGDASDVTFQACSDAVPGDCSLRGAIIRANASTGIDSIAFDIPPSDPGYMAGSAHWRISPESDLPAVTDDLIVDGYTQPGANANTLSPDQGGSSAALKIELHGNGSGSSTGLAVVGGKLVVRGLAMNRFQTNLALYSPGQHRVEGCFIGTDISGMQSLAANGSSFGIRLRGQAVIGGTLPALRNVISGNSSIGIWDESGTTTAQPSTIQGNLIGLGADGATVLPVRQRRGTGRTDRRRQRGLRKPVRRQ